MPGRTPVPWMSWTLAIVVGMSLGAAATVGVTLAAEEGAAPKSTVPAPVISTVVQYGDRTDDRSRNP